MSISTLAPRKSRRELIVVLKPETGVVDHAASLSATTPSGSRLAELLTQRQATMRPIFPSSSIVSSAPEFTIHAESGSESSRYHEVTASDDQLDDLKAVLSQHPAVETAYIKPGSSTPSLRADGMQHHEAAASVGATPDYSSHQIYLGVAPAGVDAHYAWTIPGGRGQGVKIVDCEWSWNLQHEDLKTHVSGVITGAPSVGDDDHGTAVIGSIVGNDNGFGITGVAPEATLALAAFPDQDSDPGTASTIANAAATLAAGDILLLEIHRPGPRTPSPESGQLGYVAIEWWPDDFLAISQAVKKGILVVEAAGNGSQNLDDTIYNQSLPDFPSTWRNPFAPGGPNSGAILVGAGNPPSGTHGRTRDTIGWNEVYVDRARCAFSNYGSRLDCQSWGWEVTTLGAGDLGPKTDHNRLYTDRFAGTSSASPIVVGVLACAQGALRARGLPLLDSASARQLLQTEGSAQQSAPGRSTDQRIGLRPDLRKIIAKLIPPLSS